MIDYDFGTWGVGFVFSLYGSVFPRALAWAVPSGALAALYCRLFKGMWGDPENYPDIGGTSFTVVWGGYTFIVGFLLVFRTQIAWARFWEGAKILWYMKGVWVNAVSNTLAFTTVDPNKKAEADSFKHFLVRLMSMLFSASLEAISTETEIDFSTLGDFGISEDHLEYLTRAPDKVEVLLNWVQRLVVMNHHTGILTIPPPILSRVFQELGNGIREFQGARRIEQYPFPFPYAQAISVFLLLNWILLPLIAAYFMPNTVGAAVLTFCTTFAVWSITYIAAELEMPFGDDPNDLPLMSLQEEFNESLRMLMHPMTQSLPSFSYNENVHLQLAPKKSRVTEFVPRDAARHQSKRDSAIVRLGSIRSSKERAGVAGATSSQASPRSSRGSQEHCLDKTSEDKLLTRKPPDTSAKEKVLKERETMRNVQGVRGRQILPHVRPAGLCQDLPLVGLPMQPVKLGSVEEEEEHSSPEEVLLKVS
eukprot:TRINITY_DN16343_c0_g1_i2.p1 TRINITY_DN16343_c0_g1~~TRINITY_DN16343_c0_g1_i2.p1  ORF type:complete len:477 (-),score=76.97 TRINITY_DN16343_c0_g1_i2:327-1757(-)